MANNVYTLKLSAQQNQTLFDAWSQYEVKAPAYALWQLKPENCVITCYESGKTVFQGRDAEVYASPFLSEKKNDLSSHTESFHIPSETKLPQAGSDEVGTGDYFGPVCVCASIVDESSIELLSELGVRDSKQLTDTDIMTIAPQIMNVLPYSLLILENEKYNTVHAENNMNGIKAKLHNQAYVNLARKYTLPSFKIIDQFTPQANYYKHLKGQPQIIYGIHFETKAEDKYPSVGASSIIARYAFLKKLEEMQKLWHMEFQKGAGPKADACAREFVNTYGMEELGKVAKLHFKNTEKL